MADDNLSATTDDGGDAGTTVADTNAAATTATTASPDDDGGSADPPSLEELASELGWSPKENWRGDGGKEWVDAATFLKSNVDSSKAVKRDLKATREAAERAARAAATITEQALARQRAELLHVRQQAFDAGDGATFSNVDAALRSMPAIEQDVPANSTESRDFQQRNAWYGVDPQATALAYVKCEELARKGADFATQLAEAEKAVLESYPQYRSRGAKGPAQVADSGTRAAGQTHRGPKGYADLPREAKIAAADFERRGRATKEEYAKHYWQENA